MRYILGTLFTPLTTMRELAEERPILPSAGVWCLACLSFAFSLRWAMHWTGTSVVEPLAEICPVMGTIAGLFLSTHPLYLLLAGPVLFLASWILRTAVTHLVAELFGGTGRALSLLATIGFAAVPALFMAPLALILGACGGWSLERGWPALCWEVGAVGLVVWVFGLIVVAIQETHRLPTRKALGVILAIAAGAASLWLLAWVGWSTAGVGIEDLLAAR